MFIILEYPDQVRVWTQPGSEGQGQYALRVAIAVQEFLTDYMDMPAGVPKMGETEC